MYCVPVLRTVNKLETCMQYMSAGLNMFKLGDLCMQDMYAHEYSCPVDHIRREGFMHRKFPILMSSNTD